MNNTNDYIILEKYPDGSQLILALEDIPQEEMCRYEDYLYVKSVMAIDAEVNWHMPTEDECRLLLKWHDEHRVDLDALNFRPHRIYEIQDGCNVFDYDSKSIVPYDEVDMDEDIEGSKGYAMRAVAIMRPKPSGLNSEMTLKKYVLQHGAVSPLSLRKDLLYIHRQLDAMHEKGMCHNDICPDTIVKDSSGHFRLQESPYSAAPANGNAVLNDDGFHKLFWAPENFIGETSCCSDQYQLAMTVYFAIFGQIPPGYQRVDVANIALAFDHRNFSPKQFGNYAFPRCMVKALRLNPVERFRCMDEWSTYMMEDVVEFNAYSDFYVIHETMEPCGYLHRKGNHCGSESYFRSFGAKIGIPNERVMEAYERMNICFTNNGDFRLYNISNADNTQRYTFVYMPNGRCSQMFRLMLLSSAVYERADGQNLYSYKDSGRAINEINKASNGMRALSFGGAIFLSYERLMADNTDCEMLITEAHHALLEAEASMKRLLDGETLVEEDKMEGWMSVPVFQLNDENEAHVEGLMQLVNVASPFARCVRRGNAVCIEGQQEHIHEGIELFEFIKNYSYQNR